MTPWQRRFPLALIACSLLALAAITATKGTQSTQAPTGQASTPPALASVPGLVPRIAIAYDVGGRGNAGVNELAWEGVKRAAGEFDAEIKEITASPGDTDADREKHLTELAEDLYYPIFAIGSTWAGPVAKVAPKHPRTWFGIVDDGTVNAPRVIGILFNEEQGAYLVGAAAALTSKTGNVGFIGAVQSPLLEKLEAGFTVTEVHLKLVARIPGADQAAFETAANNAKSGCPISRLLNAKITLDAQLVS